MSVTTEKPDIGLSDKESRLQRLTKKAQNSPFIAAGLTGWVLAAMYGAYHYKKYGPQTKLSLYLIQLRVAAQGIVVGACTLGVGYTIYRDFIKKPDEDKH